MYFAVIHIKGKECVIISILVIKEERNVERMG